MALMILMSCNKIIAACQSLFYYNHLSYFESDKSKYLWSVYPNIPLFDTKHLLYFLFSLVLVIILLIFNLMLISKKLFQGNHFIFTLDGYQGTLKEKHMYWPLVELLLRFITTAFSVLTFCFTEHNSSYNVCLLFGHCQSIQEYKKHIC